MLNLLQAQKLSLKKIKFSPGKSLLVIIPISIMFAVIVIAASEATNLITVAHNSIFSPIQSQNEVLELDKSTGRQNPFDTSTESGYTTTDNTLISQVANVENVNLVSSLPITNIKSTDLFADKSVTIGSLAGFDASFASLYTDQSFSYTSGTDNAIPIILNANDFSESYEDWGGLTEISVDYTKATDATTAQSLATQTPAKTRAISYDRDSLIGKTITLTVGGLDTISDIKQESTTTGFKYVQKTAAEIATETESRKTAISKYWDYEKISTPLQYTFVVVGISEGTDKSKTYVPNTFAAQLLNDYLKNQITAKNGTAIPEADQNATYKGLVYDGVTLENDTNSVLFAGIRNQVNNQVESQISDVNAQIDKTNSQITSANSQNQRALNNFAKTVNGSTGQGGAPGVPPGGFHFNAPSMIGISSVSKLSASNIKVSYAGAGTSYNIPGLVFNKDRTTGTVSGTYTSFDFTKALTLASNTILIKVNDLANRDQVITDLNTKGYNYQDFSQYKQFNQLETYLYMILNIGSLVFMVLTALLVLINMVKFVSEGKKEIGIFRAIGATKLDIAGLFISQSIAYIVISILLGLGIGAVTIFGLSGLMVGSAQSFIKSAIGSNMVLNANISSANFLSLNWQLIALYAGALLVLNLIVSLIPSGQAAKVSPVDAIRNA